MRSHALVTIAAIALSACARDHEASEVIGRDSAGVAIVEVNAPVTAVAWRLAPTPRVSIGVVDGDPAYQFTQIQSVGLLPDGHIFVGQLSSPPQVRIYDTSGKHIRSIGRAGSGPGELSGLSWADVLGEDTIRVYDFWGSRITYFGLEGEVLREIPIQSLGGMTARLASTSPGFAKGDLLARANQLTPRSAPKGTGRSTTFLLRVKPTGETVDSFDTAPYVDYISGDDGVFILPFGRVSGFYARDSLVYAALGDAYAIHVYAPGGRLQAIHRHDGDRRTLTSAMIDSYTSEQLARIPAEDQRGRLQQFFADAPWPGFLPAYTRSMLGDDQENVWVERYVAPEDSVRQWDVFSRGGEYLVTVDVPSQFRLKEVAQGLALGVWMGDLDVQSVRAYELER